MYLNKYSVRLLFFFLLNFIFIYTCISPKLYTPMATKTTNMAPTPTTTAPIITPGLSVLSRPSSFDVYLEPAVPCSPFFSLFKNFDCTWLCVFVLWSIRVCAFVVCPVDSNVSADVRQQTVVSTFWHSDHSFLSFFFTTSQTSSTAN